MVTELTTDLKLTQMPKIWPRNKKKKWKSDRKSKLFLSNQCVGKLQRHAEIGVNLQITVVGWYDLQV